MVKAKAVNTDAVAPPLAWPSVLAIVARVLQVLQVLAEVAPPHVAHPAFEHDSVQGTVCIPNAFEVELEALHQKCGGRAPLALDEV